jgi:hypothetical protein
MYQLTELFQKLSITPSQQVTDFLVKAGFKIDKGLISGSGVIDGQTFNAEEALIYLVSKTNSALTTQQQANIQQPSVNLSTKTGAYEVKSSFNLSIEDVIATGNQQLNEAAMSGYQVGVASADLWEGAFSEAFLSRKAEHQLYNIQLIRGLDGAIITGTDFKLPEITGATGGKFRPALPSVPQSPQPQ